jgi:epsilon-lactone hydrolase
MGMNHRLFALFSIASFAVGGALLAQARPGLAPAPQVQDDGTIATPAFDFPFSSFASEEARAGYVKKQRTPMPIVTDIAQTRRITDDRTALILAKYREIYPASSVRTTIAGVPVETFTPKSGVARSNSKRILISLHGGGFITGGGGPGGALEALSVAGEARIKVMAVDYRLAPEHHFPAAIDDVVLVYRELLKNYRPHNIGIYGCSAGGMLTAQAVVRFQKERLPAPGAIGVFCASLFGFGEGDSAHLWPRMGSTIRIIPPQIPETVYGAGMPYLAGQSASDPLVRPGADRAVLKAFPPTLFLTGTRAPEMSGAAQSHLLLRELGVKSELLLFDGLDHGFYVDPSIPESQTANRLIARFFADHLGKRER